MRWRLPRLGGTGEVRYLGEIDNTPAATSKLVSKLAARYQRLWFCYEAGPTGYGLYRQITGLGHACMVVAPSLIPKKPGDRVKTNRRDALGMVTQFRAGELTAVWVPDPRHEAMRDLTRARGAAVEDLRAKRQHVSSFLLRLGWHYPGNKTWTKTHMTWLVKQKLEHAEQRIAFEEMLLAVRQAQERIGRLEEAIRGAVPDWSLAEVVDGADGDARHRPGLGHRVPGRDRRPVAVSLAARVDGLSRPGAVGAFDRGQGQARGDHQGRQPAGATHSGGVLVGYRHPPRVGKKKQDKVAAAPQAVRDIAWKAQHRLDGRYRALIRKGKLKTVAVTAIARELSRFHLGRQSRDHHRRCGGTAVGHSMKR